MYTVVLMAALTTSSSTPDWGHQFLPSFPNFPSISPGPGLGYGYTGIGYTCRGWMGHGGVYNGVWAGGYTGAHPDGYGGYAGGDWGCLGLAGPHAAWPVGAPGGYGSYGGYSAAGVPLLPGVTYLGPSLGSPVPPASIPPVELAPAPRLQKTGEQTRAKVRIEMPADAKLFVDGMLMQTTSAVRLFETPVLDPNQTNYYELKVELIRNNQVYTDARKIVVRPGEQTSASFAGLEQRAAAAQAAPATAQR